MPILDGIEATKQALKINPDLKPEFNQQYRIGDIRHCFADISKIKIKLRYKPSINFKKEINDMITRIKSQKSEINNTTQNDLYKLTRKGLYK